MVWLRRCVGCCCVKGKMDRDHFGSGDDDEDHSEDQGQEGEEEYEQEDSEEVILHDFDGDRSAFLQDHPFVFGGHDCIHASECCCCAYAIGNFTPFFMHFCTDNF